MSAQVHIAGRATRFLQRTFASKGDSLMIDGAFHVFEDRCESGSQPLNINAVDLPLAGDTCEPLDLVSTALAEKLRQIEPIFPDKIGYCEGLRQRFRDGDERTEYVRLCARTLLWQASFAFQRCGWWICFLNWQNIERETTQNPAWVICVTKRSGTAKAA